MIFVLGGDTGPEAGFVLVCFRKLPLFLVLYVHHPRGSLAARFRSLDPTASSENHLSTTCLAPVRGNARVGTSCRALQLLVFPLQVADWFNTEVMYISFSRHIRLLYYDAHACRRYRNHLLLRQSAIRLVRVQLSPQHLVLRDLIVWRWCNHRFVVLPNHPSCLAF